MKPEAPNKPKQTPTTGHSWDGIEEYNNPLPRWWVWVFLATVIFAIGYVLYYPAVPGGQPTPSKWTSVSQLDGEIQAAKAQKGAFEQQVAGSSLADITKNPDLHTYANAAGKAVFALNCAQCHGAGGAGAKGYPNLLDDEWIHGGRLADIYYTVTHGVRSNDDAQTRQPGATMPAFGKDELLNEADIADVVNYLSVLSKRLPANDSTRRGEKIFADNCTSCHGDKGQGSREMGAPPLDNNIWLYGGSTEERHASVFNGRGGVMPAWGYKLSDNEIKEVAVYVHGLGGGEADAVISDTLVTQTVPPVTPVP